MSKPDVEEVAVEESSSAKQRKADLQAIIDAYKVSNPVKFELKKDEFARKLAAIK